MVFINKINTMGYSLLTTLTLNAAGFNKGVDQAKTKTKEFAKGVEGAGKSIKEGFGGITNLLGGIGGQFSSITSVASGGAKAFGSMIPAIKGIKTALISTGIGAIVVALGVAFGALSSYLTGTKDGADKLNTVLGYAKGIFTAILNRVQLLGEAIALVFQGKFGEAGQKLKEAFSGGLLAEIQETANKSIALSQRENALKEAKNRLIRTEAELTEKISDEKLKIENKELSSAERMQALKNATNLINKLESEKLRIAKEEYEILTQKNKLGNNTYEDDQKEAELYAAMLGVQRQRNEQMKELVTKQAELNALVKQENELRNVKAVEITNDTVASPDNPQVNDIAPSLSVTSMDTSQLDMAKLKWKELGEEIKSTQNLASLFATALEGIGDIIADLVLEGKANFKDLFGAILQGLKRIIIGYLASAIAGMIQAHAKQGIIGLALAAIGIAGIAALWSKLPKFESGGIVPGVSYSGDKVHILANSGERILTAAQNSNFTSMLNNGLLGGYNNGGELTTRVSGNDLVFVLNNYNKKYSRI